MKLTAEQATQIEQSHNVYVDPEWGQYTHGEREDAYGWDIIPLSWIDEVTEKML